MYQSTIDEPPNISPRESIRELEPREPASLELPEGIAEISPSEAKNGSSNPHSSLAKSFGYFEHSDSNTMALLKKVRCT